MASFTKATTYCRIYYLNEDYVSFNFTYKRQNVQIKKFYEKIMKIVLKSLSNLR